MPRINRSYVMLMFLCAGLSACATATPISTTTPVPTETFTPTAKPPTETLTPTPEPTANPEDAYYQSLTPEQQALFDQTKDMTGGGFTRQFLAEQGLTSYLAYYDKDGEVAFVWNFEQGKPNPALKIENNLLINETSGSHIIWNPELNRAEAQKTLADYFRYARARVIAGANHVELGNTLESALANPLTQKYLEEGRKVTLNKASASYTSNGNRVNYNVPSQRIEISDDIPIVFKNVSEADQGMILLTGYDKETGSMIQNGVSFEQGSDGILVINYYHTGLEDLSLYAEYKDLILARRMATAFQSLFGRAERPQLGAGAAGNIDTVTSSIIFGSPLDEVNPLLIYSQTR